MVGHGRGGRGTGINIVTGGGGGIYTVDASLTWAKTAPTTDPPASVNGESGRPSVSGIGCATTTLNDSSFKGSGAVISKTLIETGYVIVVYPVVVVVAESALYPPSSAVAGRRGSRVWILPLLMLMVAAFVSPPPRSKHLTKTFLRLSDVVAFVPISTSRTVRTRIPVFLFVP